ncbi:MAG: 30S ribosomal protein S7 [Chloroflexi bacterium]|nr:MAG: 30S ribosomal protein S7 [Chloroflexota bacterium]
MPRRGRAPRREIEPDPRYESVRVARFINKLMTRGKKSVAERIFYSAMDIIEERTGKNPMEIFEQALQNATPLLEVKPRRVGGSTYQIPIEIRPERRESLAMRWLIQTARNRPGKSMAEKLANELMDAANGVGATIKKKDDTHRMAEANKAFAHYRW